MVRMFRVNIIYFSLFFILFFSNNNKILRRYLNTLSSFSLNWTFVGLQN